MKLTDFIRVPLNFHHFLIFKELHDHMQQAITFLGDISAEEKNYLYMALQPAVHSTFPGIYDL